MIVFEGQTIRMQKLYNHTKTAMWWLFNNGFMFSIKYAQQVGN